jgi:L,D-transpeptidase catalytic domain
MFLSLTPRVAVLAATCILNLTTALADDPTASAVAAAAPAQTGDPAVAPASPVASAVIAAPGVAGAGNSFEIADRIVVRKSARRLLLMHDDRIVADYPIRLGLNPVGPKEREGDFRTPEGAYWLTRRNQYSDFFLSIEVS